MVGSVLDQLVGKAAAALAETGTEYALVGGIAMMLSGRDRSTRDLDIVVCLGPGQLESLRSALREQGFSHMDRADRHRLDGVNLYRFWLAVGNTGMSASLDVQEGLTDFHRSVLKRARPASFGATEVPVASAEDLILLKLLAGRPIDLADALELVRIHGTQLELEYLRQWAERLGILESLDAALREAREEV